MILLRILSRDVLQFMTVFMFFVVAFGGGLYFALRGESCGLDQSTNEFDFSVALNTSHCLHPDETRFSTVPCINFVVSTILLPSLCLDALFVTFVFVILSELYLSWLTGIRLLTEGNVIDNYIFGEKGFRFGILYE